MFSLFTCVFAIWMMTIRWVWGAEMMIMTDNPTPKVTCLSLFLKKGYHSFGGVKRGRAVVVWRGWVEGYREEEPLASGEETPVFLF